MPAVVNEETMEIKSPKTNENSKAKKTSSLYLDNYKESEWADAWGISDEKFAADFLQAVDTEKFANNPQFVFWKNHSNHSPYSVDVFGMGFDPSVVFQFSNI